MLAPIPSTAQWSAEPGATVRNAFGPQAGNSANECRGACGAGCPDSCAKTVSYECQDASRLRRVGAYDCGTHQGCRVHDDCLDACLQSGAQGRSCATQCDAEIMDRFGFESAGSWLMGEGPYDGEISFEYTRDAPDAWSAFGHHGAGGSLLFCDRETGVTFAMTDNQFEAPSGGDDARGVPADEVLALACEELGLGSPVTGFVV